MVAWSNGQQALSSFELLFFLKKLFPFHHYYLLPHEKEQGCKEYKHTNHGSRRELHDKLTKNRIDDGKRDIGEKGRPCVLVKCFRSFNQT